MAVDTALWSAAWARRLCDAICLVQNGTVCARSSWSPTACCPIRQDFESYLYLSFYYRTQAVTARCCCSLSFLFTLTHCDASIYALSCGWLPLLAKPSIEPTFEAPAPETPSLWQPYPLLRDKQPSMLHEVLYVTLDVVDIIRDILEYSHSKISEPELGRAASIYRRLREWKGGLPDKLLASFSTLPCILLLQ